MATPLDMSLLQSFSGLFLFIMVYAVVYAVLGLTKVLGEDKKTINAIVALCFAIFISFSAKPNQIISTMIPWVAMVIVLIMFLLLAMRFMFGAKEGDDVLISVLGGGAKSSAGWWVFVAIMGIFLVALSSSVGPEVTPGSNTTTTTTTTTSDSTTVDTTAGSTETGNWQTNVLNTIYHPKVLGMLLILAIALAAIKMLSTVTTPK
jgi:hypothetical protein